MTVKCPKCTKAGTVTLDKETRIATFRCNSCYTSEEKIPQRNTHEATGQCSHCARYYRIYLKDSKHPRGKIQVACPYCSQPNQADIAIRSQRYIYAEPSGGKDPYFGYPLYYQDSFRGQPIWALNREHLQYLIDYLGADQRKHPIDYGGKRTQSDTLPTFMKTAKNRPGIIKLLEKMLAQ